ncbi:hypothetical protein AAC387_Pa01g4295 [Persea americana]
MNTLAFDLRPTQYVTFSSSSSQIILYVGSGICVLCFSFAPGLSSFVIGNPPIGNSVRIRPKIVGPSGKWIGYGSVGCALDYPKIRIPDRAYESHAKLGSDGRGPFPTILHLA